MSPTTIEWARNPDGSPGETWNPTVGCSRVSPGCDHCYAIKVAAREMQPAHVGLTAKGDAGTDWTGEVRCMPDRLEIPTRRKAPTTWFVDSMSDLFHPEVLKAPTPQGEPPFLARVFAVMVAAERHTFQVLTKRPQVACAVMREPMFRLDVNAELLRRGHAVMPGGMTDPAFVWPRNLWVGTSIESDRYAFRADHLRATPAAVRFLSVEPLLGPVPSLDLTGIDWVIVGGESGNGARPMHPDWARDVRDRCAAAGVPFFFKQWGAWKPRPDLRPGHVLNVGATPEDGVRVRKGYAVVEREWASGLWHEANAVMQLVGKKKAGRELDGRAWDETPAGRG